jgi:hypothetical protein
MKSLFMTLFCVLITGCSSVSNNTRSLVYLYQFAEPRECVLAETGPVNGRSSYRFTGKVREVEPQVYECSIEIPMKEFERKLGYCVMRGHNYSAGYDFFKGRPGTRSHSCDARPLANGNFYFNATGIDQDNCDWLCFPEASK